MKSRLRRLILTVIFLCAASLSCLSSATELTGFLGIPWGTNRADFRLAMEKLGYSFYKEEELGNIKHQMYENGPYATYNVYVADAQFKGDAMYDGGIIIKFPSMPYQDVAYIYKNIKSLLIDKYGAPTAEAQTWEMKMGPNVGVTITRATWKIPNGDKDPHTINLTYTPAFYYPGDKRQWGNSVDVDYKNAALEKDLDKGEAARL